MKRTDQKVIASPKGEAICADCGACPEPGDCFGRLRRPRNDSAFYSPRWGGRGISNTLLAMTVLSGMLFLLPSFAFAAEIEPAGTPLRKLQRGFLNIALSPIEISSALQEEKYEESFIPSWAIGAGRGSMFAVGRVLAGIYEILTFPIPLPSGYEPVVAPEFAWQHFEN